MSATSGESVHVRERPSFASRVIGAVIGQGIAVVLINVTCVVLDSPWRWGWHRG